MKTESLDLVWPSSYWNSSHGIKTVTNQKKSIHSCCEGNGLSQHTGTTAVGRNKRIPKNGRTPAVLIIRMDPRVLEPPSRYQMNDDRNYPLRK